MSRSYASVPFPSQGGGGGQGSSNYAQGHSYSHSQPQQQSGYTPQPPPPQTFAGGTGGQQTTPIQPGSLTYTTTRNSQGETVYHAFIAQAVNYQTPEGLVQGIKWVPADSVRANGAGDPNQQSGPDFGDEGGVYVPQPDVRGMSEKQKEKALKAWQKENKKEADRRQRKMEKEQEKQWENEERERIRAEAKEKKDRERRMSSGNGIGFDRGAAMLERQRSVGAFERERDRKISTGYGKDKGDRGRGNDWERERTTSGGMLGLSRARSQSRSRKASIHGDFDTGRTAGGGYDQRASGYGAEAQGGGTGSAYPYVNTTVLPPRFGDQPSPSGYPTSNLPPASPGHGSRGSQGYHSASKQPSPRMSGGHSPYMAGGQFPPGHPTHRTAQSEGGGGFHRPPAGGGSSYGQPLGPVDINREPNRALPYTWFEPFIVIPDMNQFFTHTAFPIMPAVMQPHDVTHDEWISFVKDIMTVWTRRGSLNDARITRLAAEVAEIIETWVGIFFQPRTVELVLFRGRERRSGPFKGRVEERLPLSSSTPRQKGRHAESESSSSSLSSSSESDDEEQDRYRYGAYSARVGVTGDHPSMRQLREMRYQRKAARAGKKAEKRRRARERKQRREREQVYSIGIFCTSQQRGAAGAGHQGMPPVEYGGRPSPQEYGTRYGATPSGTPMSQQPSMAGGHDPYAKYVPVTHGSTAIPPLGSQTPYTKYVDTSKSNPYQSSPGGHAML